MSQYVLFIGGVALLLWQARDEIKNPSPPEPFTWSDMAAKVFAILFWYVVFTATLGVFDADSR